MTEMLETVDITIKEVWSDKCIKYGVYPDDKIRHVLSYLMPHFIIDFNMSQPQLVVVGQQTYYLPSEMGEPLKPSDKTIRDLFGPDFKHCILYIKDSAESYRNPIRDYIISRKPIFLKNVEYKSPCSLCASEQYLFASYTCCTHKICQSCYDNDTLNNANVCPCCNEMMMRFMGAN